MESNWRWNVAEWGHGYGVIQLIARRLDVPGRWIAGFGQQYGGYDIMGENPPFSGYLQYDSTVLVPTGIPFPFGVPVEPDS